MSHNSTVKINQKEYLKKYLSGDKTKKKKKKKAKKHGSESNSKVRIIDDDAVAFENGQDSDEDLLLTGEDAPQIVGEYIEAKPNEVKKWRNIAIKEELESRIKMEPNRESMDLSPPRQRRGNSSDRKKDDVKPSFSGQRGISADLSPNLPIKNEQRDSSDLSPPRGRHFALSNVQIKRKNRDRNSDLSPSRRRKQQDSFSLKRNRRQFSNLSPSRRKQRDSSDQSPNRRKRQESLDLSPKRYKERSLDLSPPRRRKQQDSLSPKRNREQSSDLSPPRKERRDSSDQSPNRRKRRKSSDLSPKRNKEKSSDLSPRRKRNRKQSSDLSPPRRKLCDSSDQSPNRRKRRESSDQSPLRQKRRSSTPPRRKQQNVYDFSSKRKVDSRNHYPEKFERHGSSDYRQSSRSHRNRRSNSYTPEKRDRSKNLRNYNTERNAQEMNLSNRRHNHSSSRSPGRRKKDKLPPRRHNLSEYSPRGRREKYSEENSSPPRTSDMKWRASGPTELRQTPRDASDSPPPTHKPKSTKTLDGKKAGLQDAQALKEETATRRRDEDRMYQQMSSELSGRDADVQVRNTGRRGRRARDAKAEDPEVQRRKEEQELKKKEQYDRWGKGLKQIEDHKARLAELAYEGNKPLARYSNDEDLERFLREQERTDDPMLEYMRRKKKEKQKESNEANEAKTPVYEGSYPENRFGIRPGYRWDGVDRSNGYEKRWFDARNERAARQEDAYKYSVEDM